MDRPRRVRGDHLHLDALGPLRRTGAEVRPDLRHGFDEERVLDPEVEEAGAGVVSKVPSRLRSATTSAPVSRRMSTSRMERPACPHVFVTSISSNRRSPPAAVVTTSMKAVTCGLRTRLAITRPAAVYGWTTRSAPASCSFLPASSFDARATIRRSGFAARADSVM